MVQAAPAASEVVQLLLCENGAEAEMLAMLSGAPPVLVSTTPCTVLAPTGCTKLKLDGDNETDGATPVPLSALIGLLTLTPSVPVTVSAPVLSPAAVGVKYTS